MYRGPTLGKKWAKSLRNTKIKTVWPLATGRNRPVYMEN